MKYTVFIFFSSLIWITSCSRILVVFHMPSTSHYILGNALARGLAEAGHDVTMVSPFEEKNPPKNGKYRNVILTGFLDDMDKQDMSVFDMEGMSPFLMLPFLNFYCNELTQNTLEHPNLQKLLKSNEHFDAVVIEQFNNDALKVLAYHFKAPLILFSTIGANSWINPLVGNPSPPSYIPDALLSYRPDMTFHQRLVNWLFTVVSELNRQLLFFPTQNKMMKEHFPDAPDLSILNYNASIVLLNSHESINQAVPLVPNMIDVGGFHVNPPKELPKDLKDYMDGAKEGVVYFSMGSNIKPSMMPKEKKTPY
ncbi:hypothetical protein NQ314_018638 [Rhamnusium bicolor]|uniref:Uncharacterized protein n=1 Tax=Rhamnusium bicolor TaxID=1586634 RepID=A0AAV8WPS1_9CUCU|nr:hypothetical protein NQ314_018638 [Rhamnusium bicolor]